MKFYGYSKNIDKLENLKEVTLNCNLEEINKLIGFLEVVKERHESILKNSNECHTHYKDWDKEWENDSPDLIISTFNIENN